MDLIWNRITEWLRTMLVGSIMGNLNGLFDGVNESVSNIAVNVGATPQSWNGSAYAMVQSLSESVMLPIAGIILTFVMTYELIQMVMDRNNLHDFETILFFKWVFKAAIAVVLVSNTWNIVMAIFDIAQSMVNSAAGVIAGDADIDVTTVMAALEAELDVMEIGPLLSLWIQSILIGILTNIMTICIFVVIYGRMLEIYLVTAVAPIPIATLANREWGQIGTNYLRSLMALGLQAVLIIVCVAVYAALVQSIAVGSDVIGALWTCIGYTVLLIFTLLKTSSIAKGILNAH